MAVISNLAVKSACGTKSPAKPNYQPELDTQDDVNTTVNDFLSAFQAS